MCTLVVQSGPRVHVHMGCIILPMPLGCCPWSCALLLALGTLLPHPLQARLRQAYTEPSSETGPGPKPIIPQDHMQEEAEGSGESSGAAIAGLQEGVPGQGQDGSSGSGEAPGEGDRRDGEAVSEEDLVLEMKELQKQINRSGQGSRLGQG